MKSCIKSIIYENCQIYLKDFKSFIIVNQFYKNKKLNQNIYYAFNQMEKKIINRLSIFCQNGKKLKKFITIHNHTHSKNLKKRAVNSILQLKTQTLPFSDIFIIKF